MKSKRSEEKEDVTQHKVYFKTLAIDVPVKLITLDIYDTRGIFFVALEAEEFFSCGPLHYSPLYFLSVYCW